MASHLELTVRALEARLEKSNSDLILTIGHLESRLSKPVISDTRDVDETETVPSASDDLRSRIGIRLVDVKQDGGRRRNPALERTDTDTRLLGQVVSIARSALATLPISLQAILKAGNPEVQAYLAHVRIGNRDVCLDQIKDCQKDCAEASLLAIGRCIGIVRDHFKSDRSIKILCPIHSELLLDPNAVGTMIDIYDRSAHLKGTLIPVLPQLNGREVPEFRDAVQRLNHAGIALAARLGEGRMSGWLERLCVFLLGSPERVSRFHGNRHAAANRATARLIAIEAVQGTFEKPLAQDMVLLTDRNIAPPKLVKPSFYSGAKAS